MTTQGVYINLSELLNYSSIERHVAYLKKENLNLIAYSAKLNAMFYFVED